MKQVFFILLFIIIVCLTSHAQTTSAVSRHHNKIDDITNIRQVKKIIRSTDKEYTRLKIESTLKFTDKICQKLYDSLKLKSYVKADFDGNGYTDLLVIRESYDGLYTFCVLDSGNNNFFIKELRKSFCECNLPVVISRGNNTLLKYFYFQKQDKVIVKPDSAGKSVILKDSAAKELPVYYYKKIPTGAVYLIYNFGDFVEYNDSVVTDYHIQKIEYKTSGCFGACPIFNLTINSDRTAKYEGVKFNYPNGKFKGTIDENSYSELISLLNYINFPQLGYGYRVGWTDDQFCFLTITYDNGEVKEIMDYGLLGTYGLARVYKILSSLRHNQNWEKTD